MAIAGKRIAGGTLTTSAAIYYTAAAGVRARIEAFSVVNFSGLAQTFSLWLVPSGGAPDNTNIVVKDRPLNAKESRRITEAAGQWIEGGGTVQMQASDGASLTVTASGIEQTS